MLDPTSPTPVRRLSKEITAIEESPTIPAVAGKDVDEVTESARAHSYISSKQVQKTC